MVMKFVFLLIGLSGAMAYLPPGKDAILSNIFLRELMNRINGKTFSENDGVSYLDFTDSLPMDGRSLSREMEEEQIFPVDYDSLSSLNIRDQEYLQHSNLWQKQYVSGGAGEGDQLLRPDGERNKQEVKTDSTLPAYCNPPNPCPVGYTEDQGCIEHFENSASYSRRYQASQDCMCDTEHMFECPNPNDTMDDDQMDSIEDMDMNRFLQNSIKSQRANPFMEGEKLPVAAKKGINVLFG